MQMNIASEGMRLRAPVHLGTIVKTLENCLANAGQTPLSEQIIWNAFDEAYSARVDYPLWRHLFGGFHRRGVAAQRAWASKFPHEATLLPINLPATMYGRHPVEQWGIVAIVAWRGVTAFGPNPRLDQLEEFLMTLNTLPPLPTSPAHCALAEIAARGKVFDFLEQADEDGRLTAQARTHVRRLCHLLRVADPDFRIGIRVQFSKLEAENPFRLVPSDHFTHVLSDVANALNKLGLYVGRYQLHIDEPSLSDTVLETAYAAWRIRRSQRFVAQRHRWDDIDYFYDRELHALKSTAFAAAAANKAIEAAGLWWIYLTMFATKRPGGGRIHGWEFGRIREAGLEIDISRYGVLSAEDLGRRPQIEMNGPEDEERRTATGATQTYRPPSASHSVEAYFCAHRAAHASVWKHIEPLLDAARLAQGERFRLERAVRTLIKQIHDQHTLDGSAPQTEVIDALFAVAMAVDFIRSALDLLLAHPRPSLSSQVVPAARAVARCTQINRVGLRAGKINEWLDVLKEKWGSNEFESISLDERLVLHQVLVGRYATMLRQLSPEAVHLAARQRYYALTAADYSRVLDDSDDAFEPGPPLATSQTIRTHLSTRTGTHQTLLISIVTLKTGLSILACGHLTGFEGWTDIIPLTQEFTKFVEDRNRWFDFPARTAMNQVRWPASFLALRNMVLALLERNPGANSVTLALEPALTGLPWQHLFSYSAGYKELRDKPVLVSLVPSISWSQMSDSAHESPYTEPVPLCARICSSGDADISLARTRIRLDYTYTVGASVGMALGHGKWPKNLGEQPEISVDDKLLGTEDWLTLARQQLLLIHACWTGHAPMAGAWEGALTAHLLNAQCRTIIAPVGRAPVEAMEAIDRHIFSFDGPPTVGERYLAAIDYEPAATLYNLYGDANLVAPQRAWKAEQFRSRSR